MKNNIAIRVVSIIMIFLLLGVLGYLAWFVTDGMTKPISLFVSVNGNIYKDSCELVVSGKTEVKVHYVAAEFNEKEKGFTVEFAPNTNNTKGDFMFLVEDRFVKFFDISDLSKAVNLVVAEDGFSFEYDGSINKLLENYYPGKQIVYPTFAAGALQGSLVSMIVSNKNGSMQMRFDLCVNNVGTTDVSIDFGQVIF